MAFSKAGNPQAGMGAALGDTDNDGLEDLFVTNFSEDYYTLYRASSSGRYRDVTAMAGLYQGTLESLGWGALLEDLDGDGAWMSLPRTAMSFPRWTHSAERSDTSRPIRCSRTTAMAASRCPTATVALASRSWRPAGVQPSGI